MHITRGFSGDYSGHFDYEIDAGVATLKANLDWNYRLAHRPAFAPRGFHDWGFTSPRHAHRNQKEILKRLLLDVLVTNKVSYPELHCVTFRQLVEYTASNGDLAQTLAIGNGQDSRNPVQSITK